MVYPLSLKDLPLYQTQGAIVIDVRDQEEYQKNHIAGSINIPYQSILEKTRNYPKESLLIVYCSTGLRSKIAANLLVTMGFTRVYDMGKVSL